MSGTDLRTCQDFGLQLQSWGMTNLTAGDLWEDELKMLLADMEKQRQQYEKQNEGATHRLVPFLPYLASSISEVTDAPEFPECFGCTLIVTL
jgi:hypothetical protein